LLDSYKHTSLFVPLSLAGKHQTRLNMAKSNNPLAYHAPALFTTVKRLYRTGPCKQLQNIHV
jgi:hypothetical protein